MSHGTTVALACATLALSAAVLAPSSAEAATLSLPSSPRVLIIGDSYTEGRGDRVSSNGLGWAPEACRQLSWRCTVDGVGGSGYVNPTSWRTQATFSQRLYAHPAGWDLIVVQGSTNDRGYLSTLAGRANMTLNAAKKRGARVMVLGPTNPYGKPDATMWALGGKMEAAARYAGLPYVDPLDEQWFLVGDGKWAADAATGHPSDAGYQRIADRFVQDVERMQR